MPPLLAGVGDGDFGAFLWVVCGFWCLLLTPAIVIAVQFISRRARRAPGQQE